MIHAFARHSSGSDGWSEVGRLEIRPGRDFAHFGAQRIEQRIGRCHRYGQKFDVVVVNCQLTPAVSLTRTPCWTAFPLDILTGPGRLARS